MLACRNALAGRRHIRLAEAVLGSSRSTCVTPCHMPLPQWRTNLIRSRRCWGVGHRDAGRTRGLRPLWIRTPSGGWGQPEKPSAATSEFVSEWTKELPLR